MAISIAEKIYDVTMVLKRDVSETLYAYSEVIANLERTHLFPNLADMFLIERLTKHVNRIDSINQQLKSYGLFDPSLLFYSEEVDEVVAEIADRFHKWTRRTTLSVKDAAERLGKSKSTIYRWIKSGKLVAQKIDRRWVVAV